ncbi:MAG: branched-chain amino acid ABC transporter permease [Acidilobaceae archaeon]|nr:branched-chain amino acid ABC transporter permease [Acidilobaceae archaeon]
MVELSALMIELGNIITFVIVVLALNLMAGFAGIPNFGMAVFVYTGAFVVGALSVRFALLLLAVLDPATLEALLNKPSYKPYVGDMSLVEIILFKTMEPTINRTLIPELSSIISQNLVLALSVLIFTFVVAVFLGVVVGVISSYAAVRLKEDYLAIALLAFSEMMVQVFFAQTDSLAGGRYAIYAPNMWPSELSSVAAALPLGVKPELTLGLILAIGLAALTYLYAERIANSPMGRALRAMRDDEFVLSTYGRDIAAMRLRVMMIGGALAALAGVIYAMNFQPVVKATDYTRLAWTFVPWAMMIIGGMANNLGVVLGAVAIYVGRKALEFALPELFDALKAVGLVTEAAAVDVIRAVAPNIFVGVLILLMLYLRPKGLVEEMPGRTLGDKLRELKEKFSR